MDWITESIAVGNVDDVLAERRLESLGVTAVLSLIDYPTITPASRLVWHRVELIDGEGNDAADLERAVVALDSLVDRGHRVLVHCMEGVSRAPFLAACYLSRRNNWDLDRAIAAVQASRSIANPHAALRQLWQEWSCR